MRHLKLLALCLALSGCASPVALERALLGYDETLADIESRLLLVNLGRAERGLPVHFTTVASVAATFEFAVESEVGGNLDLDPAGAGALQARIGTRAVEAPTVSFVPIQGQEYAQRFLAPLSGETFASLAHQDEGVGVLLRLLGEAVFELRGKERVRYHNDPASEGYETFRRWVMHLGALERLGALDIGRFSLGSNESRVLIANYDTARIEPKRLAALRELALGYPKNFVVVDLMAARPGGEWALRGLLKLRSFQSVLRFVARGLDPAFEREVSPHPKSPPGANDPARTLAIERDGQGPSLVSATYAGRSLSLPLLPDPRLNARNARAFRTLHHLLQLTVHGTPPPPTSFAITTGR